MARLSGARHKSPYLQRAGDRRHVDSLLTGEEKQRFCERMGIAVSRLHLLARPALEEDASAQAPACPPRRAGIARKVIGRLEDPGRMKLGGGVVLALVACDGGGPASRLSEAPVSW